MKYTPGLWSSLVFKRPVGWFETDFSKIRVHALDKVPVADGVFPVVVLEPGMGFAVPQYTALAEDLASHGYIVAGLTPTYSANLTVLGGQIVTSTKQGNPPDLGLHSGEAQKSGDRLASLWAADARFVAGQVAALGTAGRFNGKIDHRVTYAGHSFGGASSLEACRTDPHCSGAVDIDGTQFGPVVHAGLSTPFLLLASEDSCITGTCGPKGSDTAGERNQANSLLKASTGPHWLVTIDGARHLNFTDYSIYFLAPPIRGLIGRGSIDGRRLLAIQNGYIAAFLDHITQGSSELDALRTTYPEAKVIGPA